MHRPHVRGRGRTPFPRNPNFFPNPNFNSNFLPTTFANHFGSPVPSFPPQPAPPPATPPEKLRELVGKIEKAAEKAHGEILSRGEHVTSWKVSQAALRELKLESWNAIGIQIQGVPYLYKLIVKEGKVDAYIHCFVGVRRITTLHELDVAICESEGVEKFEELQLGPLLQHPLVIHYFSIPSDATEVPEITAEDIAVSLDVYMGNSKKRVATDEFLDFLKEKYSVADKEKLGVRIRSLGLYINYLRNARKAEYCALQKTHVLVKHNYGKGKNKVMECQPLNTISEQKSEHRSEDCFQKENDKYMKTPDMISEKANLDKRFDSISSRVNMFSASLNGFGNSHLRFDFPDDDIENSSDRQDKSSPQGNYVAQRGTSCPYPSTTEEIARLGLKTDRLRKRSPDSSNLKSIGGRIPTRKKRKLEKENWGSALSMIYGDSPDLKVKIKDPAFPSHLKDDIILDYAALEDFAATWKEACKELSVLEVLNMMLSFYGAPVKKKKTKRLLAEIFSSNPGIGLLNVAVTSIKLGLLDSLCDMSLSTIKDELGTDYVHSAEAKIDTSARESETCNTCVTVDDIVEKVVTYFNSSCMLQLSKQSNSNLALLKIFRDCELWVATEFSVKQFSSLGYGDFLAFLEKNSILLPGELCKFLMGNESQESLLVVSMIQSQVQVFLSQIANGCSEKDLSRGDVSLLLGKQFPTISLKAMENVSQDNSLDVIRMKVDNVGSCSVLFSSTLLGKPYTKTSSAYNRSHLSSVATLTAEDDKGSLVQQVSHEDAIKCLTKAPLLSDLYSWSHWDLLYEPSLGSLLEWLLTTPRCKELLCIVTRDGKFIRIDHSASPDQFLEAAIQGSSFLAAVKLISVIPLYGGMCNAPLSLLKHFAQRAIDVMIKNTIANVEVEANRQGLKRASSFILDCLTHLPHEFRSFGAEILLPGLQAVSKDAYTVILSECKQIHQRLMLHDIGLSLGIIHWVEDYNAFKSLGNSISLMPLQLVAEVNRCPEIDVDPKHSLNASQRVFSTHRPKAVQSEFEICLIDAQQKALNDSEKMKELPDANKVNVRDDNLIMLEDGVTKEANLMIETIRREEFGLDPNQECSESSLLKKQHARLGRALQCLSQELYSQDSHLLLELIQNADDNVYLDSAEPSLIFILQDSGIVILNNEQGFTVENIRALCDVGNSTKKGGVGYIGRKGIGFKSVFRVTDAPEIHSNGFHVKFDISEGQIGFVLPTVVSPCDINNYTRQLPCEVHLGASWNTCIVLPFRSNLRDDAGINSVISLFSDLHPSLLLFLHRLNCIAFKNMFNDDFIVMRKENMGDGIVRISHGNEKMSWLVVHNKLQTNLIRSDVQITEIAIAFTLEELDYGGYRPHLSQQPVFAFLPLRQYGLKFILQGDFVLPSSREEVDGDSAWNQWLLSEFPSLFVTAEKSFCNLTCFKNHPGKAVSTFMSFVPLVGEVYGFFSHLPNMILSKLRISNCLILEDHDMEWVPPCRVLRGWDEQARILISDSMLEKHLGLGYLKKDIFLSDSLARALGIQNYGPKTLVDIISSICDTDGGIECMGFGWLSSWLIAFSSFLHVQSTGDDLIQGIDFDLINYLQKIQFLPLLDGSYGSVSDGPIWLSCESFNFGFDGKNDPQSFPHLHRQIRTVNPLLLSAEMSHVFNSEERKVDTLKKILNKIGVRELSDHEIIRTYVLHGLADGIQKSDDENLLIEYLSFVMLHFQSGCYSCSLEKEGLISELRKRSIFLTNHGCKSPMMEPIHFGKEFKNPIKLDVLIENDDPYWHEIDSRYLKHPGTQTLASSITKWRQFFLSMGVTDFVQVLQVQKNASDTTTHYSASMTSNVGQNGSGLIVDWESPELLHLLSTFSSKNCLEKCKYLLEVLDNQWDDYYGAKVSGYLILNSDSDKKPIESSFLKSIRGTKWIVTCFDKELRLPKDVYFECEAVCSLIGAFAPYAASQVSSKRLLKDIGFKTQVTLDDALTVLQQWALSCSPFSASISQMSNFYFFIWDNVSLSREKIWDSIKSIGWIFVPFIGKLRCKGTIPGQLLTHKDVYWQDPTGCVDQIKDIISSHSMDNDIPDVPCRTLAAIYPSLHGFFVKECRVAVVPSYLDYVAILFQLSRVSLPSKAAPAVFRVLLKWANDLKTGIMKSEEVVELKNSLSKLEHTVLPTIHDRWVSLHQKCGVICWCDDEELRSEFKCFDKVCFLQFGELNDEEKEMLNGKIAVLLQRIGVPALSKVVSREASFNGADSNQEKVLLINWILPYAQRYIHKLCQDTYLHVKELMLEKLQRLQVSVVQNLFYKHTLMGQSSTSKRRHKCNSLLQGDILYTTRNSDSHSLFSEFSRIFFNGSRNLHLTNFLHMITTMAESGSSKEQIDFFILNSQEVPKLPVGEPLWPTLSVHSRHEDKNSSENLKAVSNDENITRLPANAGTSANWPPTDWKNAPGVTGLTQQFRLRAELASHGSPFSDSTKPFGDISSMENTPYVGDLIAVDTAAATTLVLQEPGDNSNQCCLQNCGDSVDIQDISNMEVQLALDDSHNQSLLADGSNSAHHINDNLSAQAPNEEEAYKTGRLGEAAAYGYFSKKLNPSVVRWANKDAETGLPYDLVIGEGEAAEYIEVKTTKSRTKNWFPITAREWQFASEKGAAFSIARVVILGSSNAQIVVLRNPVELCQKNMLNLAILMS